MALKLQSRAGVWSSASPLERIQEYPWMHLSYYKLAEGWSVSGIYVSDEKTTITLPRPLEGFPFATRSLARDAV